MKQRICTICDKICLHNRLIPCIRLKVLILSQYWGYCLDRFFPDENTVLSQQLKAKNTMTFFVLYSLGFMCMGACRYQTYITMKGLSLIRHI